LTCSPQNNPVCPRSRPVPADAGLVVLREIAKGEAKPNVIVFTPGLSAQQARAARKLGAFIVLNKARDLRQLPIQVCAAWLRRHEASEEKNAS